MDQKCTYRISAGVVARELSGEMVILELDQGIYYGLNEVGTRIWQLLDEEKTADEICEELVREYDVSRERLQDDVLAIIRDLEERGLIIPS